MRVMTLALGLGLCASAASAQLELSINSLTPDEFSFTISGTVTNDVIGDQKNWIAVKPDWSNNIGVNVPWVDDAVGFDLLPGAFTVVENSVLINGVQPVSSIYACTPESFGDAFYFDAGFDITAGMTVNGTLTVQRAGAFDDSVPVSDFQLLSGFDSDTVDWARLEAGGDGDGDGLTLTINNLTSDQFSFSISGALDSDVIGDQQNWIAVKPDWSNNIGVNVPWVDDAVGFDFLPGAFTVVENSVLINGVQPVSSIYACTPESFGDAFYFDAGFDITAGMTVNGTLTVQRAGTFDDSVPVSDFQLLSGFDSDTVDWARLEASGDGAPCVADFNNDGDVNTLDVLSFLNAWSAGDASGDINQDGNVDTLDVLAFLNEWNAGC